jgi:hypothetical protein
MTLWLLVAHIAVLGYWLGSELVINSTYRLACYADDMPFIQRDRLMDHVMKVDQHVRYALVLQVSFGVMLAGSYGFIPGGPSVVIGAALCGIAWLVFVEAVHRLRKQPVGQYLGRIDRGSRYVLIAALVATAIGLVGGAWPMPDWLRWKLAAFSGVVACGVGIRIALITHFRTWTKMAEGSVTPEDNAVIKRTYVKATSVLVLLWIFIAIVTILSIVKPT